MASTAYTKQDQGHDREDGVEGNTEIEGKKQTTLDEKTERGKMERKEEIER